MFGIFCNNNLVKKTICAVKISWYFVKISEFLVKNPEIFVKNLRFFGKIFNIFGKRNKYDVIVNTEPTAIGRENGSSGKGEACITILSAYKVSHAV